MSHNDSERSPSTYNFSEIAELLQEMQENTVEDETGVDVILAPHDEQGYAQFEVTANEDASVPEFLLDLQDIIEAALQEGEYDGRITHEGEATVFMEDIAEELFTNFDREDRK